MQHKHFNDKKKKLRLDNPSPCLLSLNGKEWPGNYILYLYTIIVYKKLTYILKIH